VLRWIRAGIIPAEQYCKGAPWVIKRQNVENQLVERVKVGRKGQFQQIQISRPLSFNDVAG
jgi:hypothetical protein